MLAEHIERIDVTVQCSDCEYIPKVADAGQIMQPEGNSAYQVMHNGLKVLTDSHYGEYNTQIIQQLKGHHEPQEEKVFYEVLKEIPPEAVMVELGSFWAYYSMWFQQQIQNAQNYMVEPIPEMLAYGQENFKLNQMHGTFIQARVGSASQEEVAMNHWDGSTRLVPQISVDDLLLQQNISYVHILHADIQSAEYEMLLGCEQSIDSEKIGYIFLSTHTDALHNQCLRYLAQKGFALIAEYAPTESYAVDGAIVGASSHIQRPKSVAPSKRGPASLTHLNSLKAYAKFKLKKLLYRHKLIDGQK